MKLKFLTQNDLTSAQVFTLSFLLAFCSFFYELCFAQLLSSLLGGTYLQYAISIGLFTFSLGMGTLIFEKAKHKYKFQQIFIIIESFIILIIFISPWVMILISNRGVNFLLYIPIILIGVLTGLELPLLINQKENILTKILAIDYLGMIFAAISFPLLFFPQMGILPSFYIVCLINLLSITFLMVRKGHRWTSYIIILAVIIFVYLNIGELNNFSSYLLEIRHV